MTPSFFAGISAGIPDQSRYRSSACSPAHGRWSPEYHRGLRPGRRSWKEREATQRSAYRIHSRRHRDRSVLAGVEVVQAGQAQPQPAQHGRRSKCSQRCLGDGQTHLLHLLFQSLLQHRNTGTTLGTRGGAGLQGLAIVVAVNDRADAQKLMLLQEHRIASSGKFGGIGMRRRRQLRSGKRSAGSSRPSRGFRESKGRRSPTNTPPSRGLCVATGHNLLVHAACGVCEQNLEAALGGAAAVTEASHLNAGELQLVRCRTFNLSFRCR